MYCKNCGGSNPDNAAVCFACGARFAPAQPPTAGSDSVAARIIGLILSLFCAGLPFYSLVGCKPVERLTGEVDFTYWDIFKVWLEMIDEFGFSFVEDILGSQDEVALFFIYSAIMAVLGLVMAIYAISAFFRLLSSQSTSIKRGWASCSAVGMIAIIYDVVTLLVLIYLTDELSSSYLDFSDLFEVRPLWVITFIAAIVLLVLSSNRKKDAAAAVPMYPPNYSYLERVPAQANVNAQFLGGANVHNAPAPAPAPAPAKVSVKPVVSQENPCPYCGGANPSGAVFCGSCGGKL